MTQANNVVIESSQINSSGVLQVAGGAGSGGGYSGANGGSGVVIISYSLT